MLKRVMKKDAEIQHDVEDAIKKIEDRDLSWQEFIDDKNFLRQKTLMAKISIPKTIMRRKFMTAISIINFYNKIFHDTTFMIKILW